MHAYYAEVAAARQRQERRAALRALPIGYGVAAFLVAQNPVLALLVARDLARQGDDTTELETAALAALQPKGIFK